MKLLFFVILNVLTISVANTQSLDINLSYRDKVLDTTFTIFMSIKNQNYFASVHIAENEPCSIVFHRKVTSDSKYRNDTLNVIPLHTDYMWWFTGKTFSLFNFKDINLDGYEDLFVLCGIDVRYGLPNYEIWLYNRSEGKYRYSEEYSDKVYSDYVLDKINKTITSSWTGYQNHNENGNLTYKIEGDKLRLIEEISLRFDDLGKYIWRHEKLINGKLEMVKQIIKTSEQVERGE